LNAVIVRRTTLAVAGLAATTLLTGSMPALAQPAAAPHAAAASHHRAALQPNGGGSVELTWAPAYMVDLNKDPNALKYTRGQALSMARRFNLLAAIPATFQKYVPEMKKINPHLTILSYANATFASPKQAKTLPPREFATDIHGNLITSTFFGTKLMNPLSKAWRLQTTKTCQDRAVTGGYDGCLVDLLTLGIFSKNFVSALPVNTHTGKVFTQTQWRSALEKLAKSYVKRDPHQIIIGNSVSNAFRYWLDPVPSRPLVATLPGAQMEDFLRGAGSGVKAFPTAAAWKQNVDVITSIAKAGHTGLFSTKLWVPRTQAQVAHWQAYAMASFLMAANGHSYFAFTDQRSKLGAMETDLPYAMPKKRLGKPTGPMKHVGSLYVRTFRHGKVVVNPTGSKHRVKLGRKYTNLQGHRVSHAKMKAHSGNVFVKHH
jgi:hypothetical protein